MKDAGLSSVDLWIGSGGLAIAELVAPVLKPRAYLPVHWDGLCGAFENGAPRAYSDASLEEFLQSAGMSLVRPGSVHWINGDWIVRGVRAVDNAGVKKSLGF